MNKLNITSKKSKIRDSLDSLAAYCFLSIASPRCPFEIHFDKDKMMSGEVCPVKIYYVLIG
jgi:hypothetical protein